MVSVDVDISFEDVKKEFASSDLENELKKRLGEEKILEIRIHAEQQNTNFLLEKLNDTWHFRAFTHGDLILLKELKEKIEKELE